MYSNSTSGGPTSCKDTALEIAPPPPYGLKIFKGYKNVIIRRDMVDFIVNHPVAKDYRNFLKHTVVPDEHLFATLYRIEKVQSIYDIK